MNFNNLYLKDLIPSDANCSDFKYPFPREFFDKNGIVLKGTDKNGLILCKRILYLFLYVSINALLY